VSASSLLVAVVAGALGVGYFVYGKKEAEPVPMLAGAGLCIVPYFIDNLLVLILVCAALLAAPFFFRS
jgi:hypothetical protein